MLSTPNGLISNKNDCIIKFHSREHLTEYYPREIEEMLIKVGFSIDEYYRKYNSVDDSRRKPNENLIRRMKIFIICRLKINDFTYRILKRATAKLLRRRFFEHSDKYSDYVIERTEMSNIESFNCDVILVKANKRNSLH